MDTNTLEAIRIVSSQVAILILFGGFIWFMARRFP